MKKKHLFQKHRYAIFETFNYDIFLSIINLLISKEFLDAKQFFFHQRITIQFGEIQDVAIIVVEFFSSLVIN